MTDSQENPVAAPEEQEINILDLLLVQIADVSRIQ